MITKKLAILACLSASLLMCNTREPGKEISANDVGCDTIHLDFRKLINNPKKLFLSDIADSVTYVALETTPEFLIGEQSVRVKPCGDYLFISEHGKPVGVFTRAGKFVRTIGKIGKGPGEYNPDFLFWPDSSMRQIIIWNAFQSSLTVYSFEGAYIGDIKPEVRVGTFAPLGNNRFVAWTFWQGESEGGFFRLFVHDGQGRSLIRFYEPQKKPDISLGIMTPLFTPAPDGYLYNTWLDDTIFCLTTEGSLKPALTWSLGSLKMPFSGIRDYQRFLREKDRYVLDISACESEDNWYLRFQYRGEMQMAFRSKSGGDEFRVANPDTLHPGVYNDLDGGPSFWPFTDNEAGRIFVKVFNSIDMLALQDSDRPAGLPVRFPEKAQALQRLISELNENSNPVVMLVALR